MNKKTFIIGEAGVNHNGSIELAKKLIDVAVDSKCDAVKFQTFKSDKLVVKSAPRAEYQSKNTQNSESQLEMLKKLELSIQHHAELIQYSKNNGIEFLSTPFDSDSLNLLCNEFGILKIKIPSGEITNLPFLLEISRKAERIILSTGMSDISEVQNALGVIAFGLLGRKENPCLRVFQESFFSDEGQEILKERVVLLHATTEYPAPCDEVNLKVIRTLKSSFGLSVGYSDHTHGIHIPVAAVAMGAEMIEKHFTLDRSLPGPDHKASLEPYELKEMVKAIRDTEKALGDGIKRPTKSEWKNRDVVRKSLVALKDIMPGEQLTDDNIGCMRPGTGISPAKYWDMIGKPSTSQYSSGDLINDL